MFLFSFTVEDIKTKICSFKNKIAIRQNTTRTFTSESGESFATKIRSDHRLSEIPRRQIGRKISSIYKTNFHEISTQQTLDRDYKLRSKKWIIFHSIVKNLGHKSMATKNRKTLCVDLAKLVGQTPQKPVNRT